MKKTFKLTLAFLVFSYLTYMSFGVWCFVIEDAGWIIGVLTMIPIFPMLAHMKEIQAYLFNEKP